MNLLTRLFPTPSFVALPTVGVDFSDSVMRFIELEISGKRLIPKRFAEVSVPEGIMKAGRIIDPKKLTAFLMDVKRQHALKYVRISIPESQVYSFSLSLDRAAGKDIRGAIELVIEDNIPLSISDTVFDYKILSVEPEVIIVQVVAVAELVAKTYYEAFTNAGIVPVSFELEGQAIARALLSPAEEGSYMIVDFGANRTGITIATKKTAIVTTTIEFGGNMLTQILAKELSIPLKEAENIKREHGMSVTGEHKDVFLILSSALSVLREEIYRRYIYWHDRKGPTEKFPPIEKIYLCGGHSNMTGLDDYLSHSLNITVVKGDPWRNCFNPNDFVPSMHYDVSMSYMTAIGLALADYI